jgi:hypothetical protein
MNKMKIFAKTTTLFLVFGIGILLFTQHIIFSSSNRSVKKFEFNNDKEVFGELLHTIIVSSDAYRPDDQGAGTVLIKLDDHQDLIDSIKTPHSMCRITGRAYTGSIADTIEIALQELVCDVNGVMETHKIDGKLIGIEAKRMTGAEVIKNLNLADKLNNERGEYRIKKIEESPPFLVVANNTIIHSSHYQKPKNLTQKRSS